ncbi:MAG: radical SAM protein [Roseburia sp.]|nr:radical SAM protein [Roseburia sp.]
MNVCTLCPRNCTVDRGNGEKGICGQSAELKVARAALHFWEEPCISGTAGSGTVFFSGCSLHCVFCQNEPIANGTVGKMITVERLAEIFLELEQQGAHNINLVTPGHFIPQIKEALLLAKEKGLALPIVYNTSSYESVESLKYLDGLVDIYLPDFKYMSSELSAKYSHAPDYSVRAKAAIAEMVRQTGMPVFDEKGEEGLIKRGTIVRHLTLPGCMEDSKEILNYLHTTYGDQIYISIMNQFTPLENVVAFPELNRKITEEEYDELIDYAIELGIEQGFIQEGETAEESFIPDFDCKGC